MTKSFIAFGIVLCIVASGCKKEDAKKSAQSKTPEEKIVLEMGDYKLSSRQLNSILENLPIEQKAKYLGRGTKGKEELVNDIAEKQLLALAAKDRKMQDRPAIHAGIELAQDSVLYAAYYREEILNKAIPETEIRAFYDQNKDRMKIPEQVKIRQIFVSPRAEDQIRNTKGHDAKTEAEATQKIEMIQAELKKGADFSELAKNWSEDPNATQGGEMPWFSRGKMVKAFEDTAFGLQMGQVSPPVKTEFGYYLIQIAEKREPAAIPYEAVRDQIQNQLASNRADLTQKMYDKLVQDLQAKYPKKLHLENLER